MAIQSAMRRCRINILGRIFSVSALGLLLASLPASGAPVEVVSRSESNKGEVVESRRSPSRCNTVKCLMSGEILPGAVMLVAKDGRIDIHEAAGYQDYDNRLPMQEDTIFRLYSLSKPIIAAAIMVLVEEGKLSLDAPLEEYLPEFKNYRVYQQGGVSSLISRPAENKVLIKHLLTHTSGFTYPFMRSTVAALYQGAGISGTANDKRYQNLAEWSSAVASIPLLSEPGTSWDYGLSMDILGRVIEVVSGVGLGEFLDAKIFTPLGMSDTGFWLSPDEVYRLSSLYVATDSGFSPAEPSLLDVYPGMGRIEMGGSGLLGTAIDYFRFAQMLLNHGELDGKRILTERSASMMISNQLSTQHGAKPLSKLAPFLPEFGCSGLGFGFGGFVVIDDDKSCLPLPIGSYGWAGAASTYFWIDPGSEIVGIYLTQLLGGGRHELLGSIACSIYC